ncbi:MAG TPA: pilus assembly protein PilP [Gallionellaceae bacterium]
MLASHALYYSPNLKVRLDQVLLVLILQIPLYAQAHWWHGALEQFKLDELSLHFIDIKPTGNSAEFLAKDGYLYTAVVGTPVSNFAITVKEIQKDRVILIELIEDKNGEWFEREIEWKIDQRPIKQKVAGE